MLSPRNRPEGMTRAFASSFRPLTPAPFVSRLWRKACLQHALRANKTLQCTLPNNVLKTGLLQRNTTKPHTLLGGTGWSVQMVLEQQKSVSPSTQTSGTNLTTLNRDLSHVTHPTYTPKTLPSWEADASFFKWHKNYTIYFREPFSWKLDRCWIFGFINIVKNGRIK